MMRKIKKRKEIKSTATRKWKKQLALFMAFAILMSSIALASERYDTDAPLRQTPSLATVTEGTDRDSQPQVDETPSSDSLSDNETTDNQEDEQNNNDNEADASEADGTEDGIVEDEADETDETENDEDSAESDNEGEEDEDAEEDTDKADGEEINEENVDESDNAEDNESDTSKMEAITALSIVAAGGTITPSAILSVIFGDEIDDRDVNINQVDINIHGLKVGTVEVGYNWEAYYRDFRVINQSEYNSDPIAIGPLTLTLPPSSIFRFGTAGTLEYVIDMIAPDGHAWVHIRPYANSIPVGSYIEQMTVYSDTIEVGSLDVLFEVVPPSFDMSISNYPEICFMLLEAPWPTGQSATTMVTQGDAVTVVPGARHGFTFTGWTVVTGDVTLTLAGNNANFTMPGEDIELQANWEVNKTVTFTVTVQHRVNGIVQSESDLSGFYTGEMLFIPEALTTSFTYDGILARANTVPAGMQPHVVLSKNHLAIQPGSTTDDFEDLTASGSLDPVYFFRMPNRDITITFDTMEKNIAVTLNTTAVNGHLGMLPFGYNEERLDEDHTVPLNITNATLGTVSDLFARVRTFDAHNTLREVDGFELLIEVDDLVSELHGSISKMGTDIHLGDLTASGNLFRTNLLVQPAMNLTPGIYVGVVELYRYTSTGTRVVLSSLDIEFEVRGFTVTITNDPTGTVAGQSVAPANNQVTNVDYYINQANEYVFGIHSDIAIDASIRPPSYLFNGWTTSPAAIGVDFTNAALAQTTMEMTNAATAIASNDVEIEIIANWDGSGYPLNVSDSPASITALLTGTHTARTTHVVASGGAINLVAGTAPGWNFYGWAYQADLTDFETEILTNTNATLTTISTNPTFTYNKTTVVTDIVAVWVADIMVITVDPGALVNGTAQLGYVPFGFEPTHATAIQRDVTVTNTHVVDTAYDVDMRVLVASGGAISAYFTILSTDLPGDIADDDYAEFIIRPNARHSVTNERLTPGLYTAIVEVFKMENNDEVTIDYFEVSFEVRGFRITIANNPAGTVAGQSVAPDSMQVTNEDYYINQNAEYVFGIHSKIAIDASIRPPSYLFDGWTTSPAAIGVDFTNAALAQTTMEMTNAATAIASADMEIEIVANWDDSGYPLSVTDSPASVTALLAGARTARTTHVVASGSSINLAAGTAWGWAFYGWAYQADLDNFETEILTNTNALLNTISTNANYTYTKTATDTAIIAVWEADAWVIDVDPGTMVSDVVQLGHVPFGFEAAHAADIQRGVTVTNTHLVHEAHDVDVRVLVASGGAISAHFTIVSDDLPGDIAEDDDATFIIRPNHHHSITNERLTPGFYTGVVEIFKMVNGNEMVIDYFDVQFEVRGYTVTINNLPTGTVAGQSVTSVPAPFIGAGGMQLFGLHHDITITTGNRSGHTFVNWFVPSNLVALTTPSAITTSFVQMVDANVVVTALWDADNQPGNNDNNNNNDTGSNNNNNNNNVNNRPPTSTNRQDPFRRARLLPRPTIHGGGGGASATTSNVISDRELEDLFASLDDDAYIVMGGDQQLVTAPAQGPTVIRFVIGDVLYTVNGITQPELDAAPFIQAAYGRTMVPIRAISEAFGASVIWDGETRTITITQDDVTLLLTVDEALPNGMGRSVIVNDRTFVPVSYIAQALGATVTWDAENSAVYIQK